MENLPVIVQMVGVAFAVLTFFVAGFWKMWALIVEAKQEATLRADAAAALATVARQELADHRLEVAQTYVTKAGMSEQTAQIMKAIDGVSGKLDHLNGRIDGLMQPKSASRARSGS